MIIFIPEKQIKWSQEKSKIFQNFIINYDPGIQYKWIFRIYFFKYTITENEMLPQSALK